MTKSNHSSPPSRPIIRTARISVKTCCFNTKINLSSSSSDESPLIISSPIHEENFLDLVTPTPSHRSQSVTTTPPPTKSPIDPKPSLAPTQPSNLPSPPKSPKIEPMELFGTAPSSPLSFLEDLENLPPRSQNTPTIEPLETPSSQPFKTQLPPQLQPMLLHPIHNDIHGPLYEEPNFHKNSQPHHQSSHQEPKSQSQHFESLFPSFEVIEKSLWNIPPNTHEEINDRLNNLYAFKSMIKSHLHQAVEFQTTLISSVVAPNTNQQTTSVPPPPQSTTIPILPNPRHGCTQCELPTKICESIKTMLHQVQDKTRFVLQHIINRLNALSHLHQP